MNSFKMLHSYKQSIWNSIINIRAAKTYQMQIVHTLRSSSQQMSKVDVENSLNVTSNLCFPFVICQGACQRIPKLDAVPTYPLADFFASIVQSPPESMSFFYYYYYWILISWDPSESASVLEDLMNNHRLVTFSKPIITGLYHTCFPLLYSSPEWKPIT